VPPHRRFQLLDEIVAHLRGVVDEFVFFDHVDHGQRRGTTEGVAAEGDAVAKLPAHFLAEAVRYLRRGDCSGQWDIAAGEAFADCHDIRRDVEMLAAEPTAGLAEAGLDFVEDEDDAVCVAQFAHSLHIPVRRHGITGVRAGNRVHDDGAYGFRAFKLDHFPESHKRLTTIVLPRFGSE